MYALFQVLSRNVVFMLYCILGWGVGVGYIYFKNFLFQLPGYLKPHKLWTCYCPQLPTIDEQIQPFRLKNAIKYDL